MDTDLQGEIMRCVICGFDIPDARLEVAPSTLTCSRDCSTENSKRIRREAAKRWRDNAKAPKKTRRSPA